MLYFAYGSNLNRERIKERCESAQALGYGYLDGFELVFQANNRGRIVANIQEKEHGVVHGVVYHITESDRRKLDGYEGHPYVYKREEVSVGFGETYVTCETYIMGKEYTELDGFEEVQKTYASPQRKYVKTYTHHVREYGLPKQDYLKHIEIGFNYWELPMDSLTGALKYSEEMSKKTNKKPKNKDKNITSTKQAVFVYGTLMKGNHNHRLLTGADYKGDAVIEGLDMYSLPYGFPCVKKGTGTVKGEVYMVDKGQLERLDCLEGYKTDVDDGMYVRRTARAKMGKENMIAVYYYLWNEKLPEGALLNENNKKWKY